MTQDEFNQWLQTHIAAFGAGLDERLRENGGRMLKLWFRALQDISVAEATAATEGMLRDASLQPRSWAGHPSAIRQLAYHKRQTATAADSGPRGRWLDGEWVYVCPLCEDIGQLSIVHPRAIARAVEDPDAVAERDLLTAGVLCTCAAAEQYGRNKVKTATYDPARHVLPAASARETLERVRAKARKIRASRRTTNRELFA